MNYLLDKKAVLFSSIILLLVVGCTPGFVGNLTATPPPVSTAIPSRTVNELQPIAHTETQTAAPTLTLPIATGKIVAAETFVNVRSGPGTNYDRIGTLPVGKIVQVTGRSLQGDWWRVSADYLDAIPLTAFTDLYLPVTFPTIFRNIL